MFGSCCFLWWSPSAIPARHTLPPVGNTPNRICTATRRKLEGRNLRGRYVSNCSKGIGCSSDAARAMCRPGRSGVLHLKEHIVPGSFAELDLYLLPDRQCIADITFEYEHSRTIGTIGKGHDRFVRVTDSGLVKL